MSLGGIIPFVWLLTTWSMLSFDLGDANWASASVAVLCILEWKTVRRFVAFWGMVVLILGGAGLIAWIWVESFSLLAYLYIGALTFAVFPVLRYIDGFWLCGWLTSLKFPMGTITTLAAAISGMGLLRAEVESVWHFESKLRTSGLVARSVRTLIACLSIILDRLVDLEIAWRSYDMHSVYERWEGRPFRARETFYLVAMVALLYTLL